MGFKPIDRVRTVVELSLAERLRLDKVCSRDKVTKVEFIRQAITKAEEDKEKA